MSLVNEYRLSWKLYAASNESQKRLEYLQDS